MPSDNLGPFAQLTPMPASFEANVRCDRVWVAVFEVLQNFDRRRDAIKALTGIDEAQWPASRFPELLGRATAVALQQCVERGLICLYLLDPRTSRFYRLPKEALVSAFVSTTRIEGQETSARAQCTSETSWATGTLFEIDCDKALYKLARERLPLMTTEDEASATIEDFRSVLDQEAGRPDWEPPKADPAAREAWIKELLARPRWPVREALLWIAMRDRSEMADLVLTAFWPEDDRDLGPPGLVWVLSHLEVWRHDRTFVEPSPEPALMQALRIGSIGASGLFESREQRRGIDAFLWEDLKLGTSPGHPRSGSAAHRKHQTHGIPWSGHWTDILFERDDLVSVFPESATDETAKPTVAQQGRCREWLSQEMRLSPDRRLKSKADFLREGRKKFGGSLSERGFETAWRLAILETGASAWSKAGRLSNPPVIPATQSASQ